MCMENRRTRPCSFKATKSSTHASASWSISAITRHTSVSTCRLLGRKKTAPDRRRAGSIVLLLATDRAPERHRLAKAYVVQAGILHQRPDLGLRHAVFDAGAEA